jgi:protease-4
MIHFLIAFLRNALAILARLALWPLWLLWSRPATLRLDLPPAPARRPPGRLARWLGRGEMDMASLLSMLDRACEDRALRGVLVTVPVISMPRQDAAGIRQALGRLVEAGKRVTLVLREGGGLREIRLAPPGARLVLHPSTVLRLEGVAAMPLSVGELLGRIGVRADLETVGEYKSAPEMFTRAELSERNREQITALLEDLEASAVRDVAEGRGVEPETVRTWMGTCVFTAAEAVEAGIVDQAAFDEEIESALEQETRVARPGDTALRMRARCRLVPLRRPVLVGVVGVRGQIIGRAAGPDGARAAIASQIAPAIDRAGRDASIAALVLDIDSRGGSPVASDVIYRQARAAAARKPVVAYLGSVAASGGYYVAAAAHEIVAGPDTITGSIGVFGGKIASDGALEKLGIRAERLTLGDPGAGIMLPDRPFDEQERALVRREMEAVYETFLDVVASRKGRTRDEVDRVARGRVYSGTRALEIDLVDGLGTRSDLRGVLADRLGCAPGRIRFRHLDRVHPLETIVPQGPLGSALAGVADTARLIATERIALELPFHLIMGSR